MNSDSLNKDIVGYKNPPKKTQFKKGQSGNPKGRPKKKRNQESIIEELINLFNEEVDVTISGQRKKITRREAGFRALYNKALEGSVGANKLMFQLIEKFVIPYEEAEHEARRKQEVWTTIEEEMTPEQAKSNYLEMIKAINDSM